MPLCIRLMTFSSELVFSISIRLSTFGLRILIHSLDQNKRRLYFAACEGGTVQNKKSDNGVVCVCAETVQGGMKKCDVYEVRIQCQ